MNGVDAMNLLFDIVKPVTLEVTGPNGRVYRRQRPANSMKEDLVIGNLAMDREDGFQNGVFNINIHAPNLAISSNEVIDRSIPDIDRLNELATMVEALFPVETPEYNFEVQSDDLEEEDTSSFINLRIEARAKNINEH